MLAAKGIEAQFYERLNVYLTMGLVLLAVFALVWLILRIRSWFIESDDSAEPLQEMLTQFRQLKREGELSEEEYRLISQRLSGKKGVSEGATTGLQSTPQPTLPESESSTHPSGD
jgi:hypothetical protein